MKQTKTTSVYLKWFTISILLLSIPLGHLTAQETITIGRSYRALAMGNTGVAIANDNAALYYNPAVLANVSSWWLDYSAWTLETSDGFTNEERILMLGSLNFPYVNLSGLDNAHKSQFLAQDYPYMRGSTAVHFAANLNKTGWTIAGSYLMEATMTAIDTTGDSALDTIFQRSDLIQKAGISIPIGLGQWVFGFSAASITRKDAREEIAASITNFGPQETAVAYDAGLLYRFSNQARITFGLVVQNYGGVTFGNQTDYAEPETVNLGFGMTHEFSLMRLNLALDLRDIVSERERVNTIHAGAEIGVFPNDSGGSFLTYRAGYNNGYITQGAEINLFNHSMVFGYTLYQEEVGTYPVTAASPRKVIYFSMGF
ncbi:MAG: hypothetical protein GY786_05905 [Proteobacteria bacterium]|nr:hypothetical protein [Pseudomonadota bacterium]